MHLSLSLMMVCLVLFIIYVFTIRLFFEKQVNVDSNSNSNSKFNFILKLPFGKTLHIILNKMYVFTKYSTNIWFYYMFICLLIATFASSYCIYICIEILKMIPS